MYVLLLWKYVCLTCHYFYDVIVFGLSKQIDAIEKQETILIKRDNNDIQFKEIIQTDNTNETIKSSIDELIHNLCNHIGEFGTKRSEFSLRDDLNTNERNGFICHTCGCSSNKKQKSDISHFKDNIIVVDKIDLKVQVKVTNVLESPKTFKDFSFVVNYRKQLF